VREIATVRVVLAYVVPWQLGQDYGQDRAWLEPLLPMIHLQMVRGVAQIHGQDYLELNVMSQLYQVQPWVH